MMLLRRTLGYPAVNSQRICKVATSSMSSSINQQHQPPIIISPLISSTSSNAITTTTNNLAIRNFAAAAKTKKATSDNKNTSPQLSYQARKDLEKQKRTERYHAQQSRLEHLKTRRANSPKDVLKTKFRTWYDNELKYHNVLLQRAKKEKKPWKIRVAVMVERIPIVTPDIPQWEREYNDLRDYIWTYGKEYPEETGFMYAMDKPEDHIVPSDEEMIGEYCFLLLLFCMHVLDWSSMLQCDRIYVTHKSLSLLFLSIQLHYHSHPPHVKPKQMPRGMSKHVIGN